jgi:hypothetical protein
MVHAAMVQAAMTAMEAYVPTCWPQVQTESMCHVCMRGATSLVLAKNAQHVEPELNPVLRMCLSRCGGTGGVGTPDTSFFMNWSAAVNLLRKKYFDLYQAAVDPGHFGVMWEAHHHGPTVSCAIRHH